MEKILVIVPIVQTINRDLEFEYVKRKLRRTFGLLDEEQFEFVLMHLRKDKHKGLRIRRQGNVQVHTLGWGVNKWAFNFLISSLFQLL